MGLDLYGFVCVKFFAVVTHVVRNPAKYRLGFVCFRLERGRQRLGKCRNIVERLAEAGGMGYRIGR